MLLTRLVKNQLRIFTVLAAFAIGMTVFVYARIPAMVGVGVYNVSVDFNDASGLYPKALVTYEGVKVGQVSSLKLSPTGTVAVLRIDNDTLIPADAIAHLHSTSAIGEQYVDLTGTGTGTGTANGDYLADGDVIPPDRAIEMPQITPVLDKLDTLLKSVPKQQTTRVLDEVGQGLGGTGRDLGGVIDSTSTLLATAQQQVDATTSLIASLRPVLGTQIALARYTGAYARSLNALSAAVATHDGDLRGLLTNGAPGLDSLSSTIDSLQPILPTLLTNLTTDASVLRTYLPELKETLVVYPATIARLQSSVNPRAAQGDVQLDIRTTFDDPATCTTGYLPPAQRRSPAVRETRKVDTLAHCAVAPSNPMVVRGVRNLPCPNSSARGPLPSSCGIRFRGARQLVSPSATTAYDLALGRDTSTIPSGNSWKILVLGPLGLTP
ncbi:MAG TPA: MlaD family protein [Nocardioides sp.]|nr:MlaD family protein [Nocardioides sp.]